MSVAKGDELTCEVTNAHFFFLGEGEWTDICHITEHGFQREKKRVVFVATCAPQKLTYNIIIDKMKYKALLSQQRLELSLTSGGE